MRTHMTKVISERVELNKLQEEYNIVMQQISTLQRENMEMTARLREYEPVVEEFINEEVKAEDVVASGTGDHGKEEQGTD